MENKYSIKNKIININEIRKLLSSDKYITESESKKDDNPEKKLSFFKTFSFHADFLRLLLALRKAILKEKCTEDFYIEYCFHVLKKVEKIGGRFEIKGFDNLRKEQGPFVLVGNHMSALETLIFPAVIGSIIPVTYVIKKSLMSHFIFGPIMRTRNPIAVERKDPRKDLDAVLTGGVERLSSGTSVVIFPQATRTRLFEPDKFNSLGIKLAKRAGVSVIPFALKTDVWANGKLVSDVGNFYPGRTAHIEFGAPVKIDGTGKKEHEQIIDFIKTRFESWK
ncbi:MAG: 1-acyl-sn-glycerol-3-phosphate acyltransferase [Spirochaetes bacterium]|nr:1-acyl-sn-glycerol-3-phosphate acyltransferase [Spirochaetota bacterium]